MPVEYPIASLAARLRLSAIRALHGQVIRDDLSWQITSLTDQTQTYDSQDAQACFDLYAGSYQVRVQWQEKTITPETVQLRRGYCLDIVILLNETGEPVTGEGYFVDSDEITQHTEFARRQIEREWEREISAIHGALADPTVKQDGQGMQIAAHPLLQLAQFDGMDQNISSDPQTSAAAEKELQLQKQLQMSLQQQHLSTPSPTAGG